MTGFKDQPIEIGVKTLFDSATKSHKMLFFFRFVVRGALKSALSFAQLVEAELGQGFVFLFCFVFFCTVSIPLVEALYLNRQNLHHRLRNPL